MHRTLNSISRSYVIESNKVTSKSKFQIKTFLTSQISKADKPSLSTFLPFLSCSVKKRLHFLFITSLSISPLMMYFRSFSLLLPGFFPQPPGWYPSKNGWFLQPSFLIPASLILAKYYLHYCVLLLTTLLWLPLSVG